jgi:predicted metal-dependent phosphoesterase TrpH
MIDLHVHSTFSDGRCDVKTLLEMAETNKLTTLSITDHDTIESYKIEVPKYRGTFSGKIITGCEVIATFEEDIIEILTFGIDVLLFEKFLDKFVVGFIYITNYIPNPLGKRIW